MTKVTLNDVGSLTNPTTAKAVINANYSTIETAFDNTLSRDGSTPNTMSAGLDMNSNRILNLPAPVSLEEPLRLLDVVDGVTINDLSISGEIHVGLDQSLIDPSEAWLGTNSIVIDDARSSLTFPTAMQIHYRWDDNDVLTTSVNSAQTCFVATTEWTRPAMPSKGSYESYGGMGQIFILGDGDTSYGFGGGQGGQVFVSAAVQNAVGIDSLCFFGFTAPGTVSKLSGFRAEMVLNIGTITDGAMYHAQAPLLIGDPGDIVATNWYGVRVDDQIDVGATNTYAYWTNQTSPGYAFYASGNAPAFFGGGLTANALIAGSLDAGVISTETPTTTTSANYTVLAGDCSIIANRAGTVTLTLLSAASNTGRWLHVKTIQAQTVVSATSNVVPLIGGAAGTAILAATAGKWATLQSDGTNWVIMAAA